MKQLTILFLFITFSICSQDFSKVDELVKKYPRFSKVEDLASKISKDFTTEEEKVRAAFVWLAVNIRYNLEKYRNPTRQNKSFRYSSKEEKEHKLQQIKDAIVAKTFLSKQGICGEYAQSFTKICDLLDIESEVISGYTRNDFREIGTIPNSTNHAWNAVKLNNKWIILDVTWAAGYEYNGKWVQDFRNYFYNIPKEKIFKTHFPDKKIWVLRFRRMSKQQFYNQPIYKTILNSNAELISPLNGTIHLKSSENIELKIKSLPSKSILYTFGENSNAKRPSIKTENGVSTLTISNPKRSTELNLFINGEIALIFKVIIR